MSFRKNLEYLRKTKKLSQEELAFKTGVSRQAVSKWESGSAYPETEKILLICKIFECTLDELMNDNIEQARQDRERKYSFNDLLDEITGVLRRTIDMFSTMTLRTGIRFILEIITLLLLISLIKIPFTHFSNLGREIFYTLGGTTGMVIAGVWNFILELVYFVIGAITFIYIYKIRFLDRYDELIIESRSQNNTRVEKTSQELNEIKTEDRKVEIRNYDYGIFSILGKLVLLFIKGFVAVMSIPIIFTLLFTIAGVVIGLVWMFENVYFIGITIFLISFILFTISILYVIFNFVVDRRNNLSRLFAIFIITILGFGIGSGIGLLELSNMSISTEAPTSVSKEIKTTTIPMSNDLTITNYTTEQYVVDNTLKDTIKIEGNYYDIFVSDIKIDEFEKNQISIYRDINKQISFNRLYSILLTDLRERKLSNYAQLTDVEVKIYASQKNIDKLEKNYQDRYVDQECNCSNDVFVPEETNSIYQTEL